MRKPLAAGQSLDGRFTLARLIKEGGMSLVFQALDQRTGGQVALKVPFSRHEEDPIYFARFQQEERIGGKIDHPSVVRTLPTGDKSRPYIVMELLDGQLLSDYLGQNHPIPIEKALDLAVRIAKAMEYIHGLGILHRDLKPANVMLCRDGTIRVFDLGLALDKDSPEVPARLGGQSLGTPDYMPPEHVLGKPGDARSDIYCLGAMLYEMVTGAVPFQAPDLFDLMHARIVGDPPAPSRLNPKISPQVEEIILRAISRAPENRYASMADFRKDLEAPETVVVTGRAQRLRAPNVWRLRWMRVRSFVWTLLIILGAIGLMVLAVATFGHPHVARHS
jgi:serine/threonine protein kinase